jgi:hypothetical protein
VPEPRDEIDTWLDRDVRPLMPPTGTLDRIRRTARRRKRRQATLAVAGCAVVVAAAVGAPRIVSALQQPQHGTRPPAVAQSPPTPSIQPSAGGTGSADSSKAAPVQRPSLHTHLSVTTSGTKPPVDFRPTSVTVVGNGSGGLVGAVIGQAGDASHPCATQYCTSLAGTSTYGKSWYGVSAPLTAGSSAPAGVSQLRFLNLQDGWAFGPGLWETSHGGWPWASENTDGARVTDLEAAGNSAFAVFATCTGSGADYASGCTSFSLYSSAGGSQTWSAVPVPTAFRQMSSSVPSSASLTMTGTTGYLLTPSGQVLSGPVAGGAWKRAGTAPCAPGPAQASGQPADAQLTAWPTLVLACDTNVGGGHQTKIFVSSTGATWTPAGSLQTAGSVTSLSASITGQLALATTAGIYHSAGAGKTWQLAGAAPAGGFTYVGMTTAQQGVAVPADADLNEIFVTSNGGRTWTPSPITDP